MHTADRVGNRHRAKSIAMIAMTYGQKPLLDGLLLCVPVLDCHLQRDFDRYRARVGKENRLQWLRCNLDQLFGEFGGRLVCQSAEHHMRHAVELLCQSGVHYRVVVTMDYTPPR